ncbi:kinase-like domain-containing protein [Cristinia sonorae]|uniref:Kinase-like domain-containing protein n=1 Tax=Cristinia sonorae TaxID=1940300 RepID=A0A8K0UHP0_9AGAR|nr:kinase-like domain-containing protein [Cristinia sonorae]
MPSTLTIPSIFHDPYDDDNGIEAIRVRAKRLVFWDSSDVRQWFFERGFNLYVRPEQRCRRACEDYKPITAPQKPCPPVAFAEEPYPYAYHGEHRDDNDEVVLTAEDTSGRILYAQDVDGRHVVFKLAQTDTDEVRIARMINSLDLEVIRSNCILPVLDILEIDERFSFIVMPRWSDTNLDRLCSDDKDILRLIHGLLKALVFLHQRRIVHRDIKIGNTLVNYFTGSPAPVVFPLPPLVEGHTHILEHAIMDFNISFIAPPTADVRTYRRSYRLAWAGTPPQPNDIWQGEFEYNPFAFDVGCMGVMFCDYFQAFCPHIPILAPLLDRMTTRDVEKRCTAEEALAFFEELIGQYPATGWRYPLSQRTGMVAHGVSYDEYDRWKDLPADFVTRWSHFREPPIPRTVRVMRWLYERDRWDILPRVRWFFHHFHRCTFGVLLGWVPIYRKWVA